MVAAVGLLASAALVLLTAMGVDQTPSSTSAAIRWGAVSWCTPTPSPPPVSTRHYHVAVGRPRCGGGDEQRRVHEASGRSSNSLYRWLGRGWPVGFRRRSSLSRNRHPVGLVLVEPHRFGGPGTRMGFRNLKPRETRISAARTAGNPLLQRRLEIVADGRCRCNTRWR